MDILGSFAVRRPSSVSINAILYFILFLIYLQYRRRKIDLTTWQKSNKKHSKRRNDSTLIHTPWHRDYHEKMIFMIFTIFSIFIIHYNKLLFFLIFFLIFLQKRKFTFTCFFFFSSTKFFDEKSNFFFIENSIRFYFYQIKM